MKHKLTIAGYLFTTFIFFIALFYSSTIGYLDYRVVDFLNKSTQDINTTRSVVIVNIDDKSLQQVGQWPWSRVITAKLIDIISQNKPKAITFDMVFSEKDKTSPIVMREFYSSLFHQNITLDGLPEELQDNDVILAQVINRSHVIFPVFSNSHTQNHACLLPDKILSTQDIKDINLSEIDSLVCSLPQFKPQGIGHIHAKADSDGVLRSLSMVMRYEDILIPELDLATVAKSKINLTKPASPLLGDMQLDFDNRHINTGLDAKVLLAPYPQGHHKTISAVDILNGDFDPKDIKDKYVLIGTDALGLDSNYILSDGSVCSGIAIHATMIENILHGDTRTVPSFYKLINLVFSLLIGLILLFKIIQKQYLAIVYIYIASIFLALAVTYLVWEQYHIYLSIGYFIGLLSSYVFVLSLIMFIVDYYKDKRFMYELHFLENRKQRLQAALKKSDQKRKAQEALIMQQSKMAVMGEMLDFIAHQWKQPLNVIGMQIQNAELLLEDDDVNYDYMSKLVGGMQKQVEYMAQTIVDFRNFVKPDNNNMQFEINKATNDAMSLLTGLFESKGIIANLEVWNEPLVAHGAEGAFKQVVVSILKNAYDIINDRKVPNPRVKIKIFKLDDKNIITIHDNAGGIPNNIIDRIFEHMFTTRGDNQGTGVGLYLSKAIVEDKLKGTLSVSNVEDGAMFKISI